METPPRQQIHYTFHATIPEEYKVDETVEMEGSIAILKAAHSTEEGPVVLKIPHPYAPVQSITALRHEAKILSKFEHPSIVWMVEYIEKEDILVMERLGNSLEQYLTDNGQPCMRRALEMMRDISEGLNALHTEGIVHCDVAARNIAFREDKLVLIDFDVARQIGEDFDGVKADPSMDMFNLGLVMCRIFSKTLPPSPYKDFIDMLLSDDPEEIPSAAAVFQGTVMALEALVVEEEAGRLGRSKRKVERVYEEGNIVHQHAKPTQGRRKFRRKA